MTSVRPFRALPNQGDRVPSLLKPISNGTIEQDAHQASDLCLGVVRQRPAIFAQYVDEATLQRPPCESDGY